MEQISLREIQSLVHDDHHEILWVGTTRAIGSSVWMRSPDGVVLKRAIDPNTWREDGSSGRPLTFVERDQSVKHTVGVCPPDGTWLAMDKKAAAFGVNIGGDARPGACKRHKHIDGCVLSYDIETSMKHVRQGAFGLVDSEILSIAAACSCGNQFYTHRGKEGSTSQSMVSEFLVYMVEHSPLWTIGWNCYTFDNECMRYHCHDSAKHLFMVSRIGGFGKNTYGSILCIPGTYNVDLLIYMSKSMYNLPSYRLGDVAKSLRLTSKLHMPDMRQDVDPGRLKEYNMNDCVVVGEIWEKERFADLLPGLAVCTASPLYDCARYVSGTLATQSYSTFVLNSGLRISWSSCENMGKYNGGFVMTPMRGIYRDIVVCDFKSMYPTIMFSCGINPHGFKEAPPDENIKPGTVVPEKHHTKVYLSSKTVIFDNRVKSPMPTLMQQLVEIRNSVRKEYPVHANVLKIAANSVYGSLGYSNSPLYSPSCAAAITSIGRFCVKTAKDVFRKHGLTVIYGDTDSCMVTCDGGKDVVMRTATAALDSLHAYLGSCSLHRMSMALEEYYPKGIMLDKKRYCMLREDGRIKSTGISIARKDVSKICQVAAESTIEAMFLETRQETIDAISSLVSSISCMGISGKFRLGEISRYVKKNERKGYEYIALNGKPDFISEEDANTDSYVDCDVGRVMRNVSSEIERFTIPCGIGMVHDIVRSSHHIM